MRTLVLIIGIALISFFPVLEGNAKDVSFYAPNSQLASGKWVKLRIKENAIYKLSYSDIQAMGINPSKVKIFGYGGWMLNENFSVNDYADDLPEVPVWISGSDNKLDPGEFLLFYGKGTVKWKYDFSDYEYRHEKNPYSDYGYYFITEGNEGPKLIAKSNAETVGTSKVTSFSDYALHEKDLVGVISSGREMYGESFFSSNIQTFHFDIKGILQERGSARISFISTATIDNTSVGATINNIQGNTCPTGTFKAISDEVKGIEYNKSWQWMPNSSGIDVTVGYSHSGYRAYLNYLSLNVSRELKYYAGSGYMFFRRLSSSNCTYEIADATADMMVFELTEGKEIKQMNTVFSNGKLTFHAEEKSNVIREYVLINSNASFARHDNWETVNNQNIHGLSQVDMIIITRPVYKDQAELLAKEHRTRDNLVVEVVSAEQVYNEFSSGNPDATAYRRLMKMFYDKGKNNNTAPKYLLLFGDGVWDNRMLASENSNLVKSNYLLTYQSVNSLKNDAWSYVTDDYFGFLEDDNGFDNAILNVGIGRLPIKNLTEAKNVVNKLIAYMDNKNTGAWKNRLTMLGGQEPQSEQYLHVGQADRIVAQVETSNPEILSSKIYYDAFNRVLSNGKNTIPEGKNKLDKCLKDGCILFNYLGHGGPDKIQWDLIKSSDVNQMNNKFLPLWIMSTCEFGRYDMISNSCSEAAVLNPNGGAIAVISASRIVNSSSNAALNEKLVEYLFSKENGNYNRLGDIIRKGKNKLDSDKLNKLSYALLGDPALMLNYPTYNVRLDSINGKSSSSSGIKFRSGEKIVLKGAILDKSGAVDANFNGNISACIMDCIQQLQTFDYRNKGIFYYTEYLNKLYDGNTGIIGGYFTIRFTVPQDISFKNEKGKISFYAVNTTNGIEAKGHFSNYIVGGTTDEMLTEIPSPEIKSMYLNRSSFNNGDVVNESPYFVAEIYDTLGINKSGIGTGHDIFVSIDNKVRYSYVLNNYYESSYTEEGKGTVRFTIPDKLPTGEHTLTFKVWNVMNKSATKTITFYVEEGKAPVIYDLTATPSPAKSEVQFIFDHDCPESLIKMNINVFDLSGTPVWSHEVTGLTDELSQSSVRWNLISSKGDRVKPGVYVYRASINSNSGKVSTASKKLIIVAQ